jgi:hypothetical protein
MNMTILFDLARGVADGTVNYSGFGEVPVALVQHVRGQMEVDHDTSVRVARLILQSMAAQRAMDLRLRDGEDGPDWDRDWDCAYS